MVRRDALLRQTFRLCNKRLLPAQCSARSSAAASVSACHVQGAEVRHLVQFVPKARDPGIETRAAIKVPWCTWAAGYFRAAGTSSVAPGSAIWSQCR